MNTADDLILWGPELMTGIGVIDEQHRVLVDMCNEANKLMQGHVDPEDVKRLVRDLMSYAMYHFEVEEELAIDEGYGESHPVDNELHREQHRNFASTVAALQQELATGKLVKREYLLGFLNSWLINHIQVTDKKMAVAILEKN
ncbi:MAG: hemerythrin family protein [Betaproteobacteria bacterium]|jgi:hemerythrin|nr:hemerythrin family protein [Betaproteobacteria bacterium]MBK7655918.1 hemerythrin family protein [Betaproteobacteria bacterium]MBP6644311.1 hemerythrin family protein [Burkholderiaceae bacterium]